MSVIIFDIVYKKRVDNNSVQLLNNSELQQLKIMLCGKYEIYDISKLYIYFKGKEITDDDQTKIKDIFRQQRVKIEISQVPIVQEPKETFKYYCKCGKGANFVCDKCDEYVCDLCHKLKKHVNHVNKLIKVEDYPNYIKKTIRDQKIEFENILKDDSYKFYNSDSSDTNKEISLINNLYDSANKQMEEIKNIEIEQLKRIAENSEFESIQERIEDLSEFFENYNSIINHNSDCDDLIETKSRVLEDTQELLNLHKVHKANFLKYVKAIKDFHDLNEQLVKEIQEKFNLVRKKYTGNQSPNISTVLSSQATLNPPNKNLTANSSGYLNKSNENSNQNSSIYKKRDSNTSNPRNSHNPKVSKFKNFTDKKNKTLADIKQEKSNLPTLKRRTNLSTENRKKKNNRTNNILNNRAIKSKTNTYRKKDMNKTNTDKEKTALNFEENEPKSQRNSDKLLLKLKDENKIIIFSNNSRDFKEKYFLDKGNLVNNLSSPEDTIQLNIKNKLFILCGEQYNTLFYYNYQNNSLYQLSQTLFDHYYGSMIYCPKNGSLYIIGGNNQKNCEMSKLGNLRGLEWKAIAPLNEDRQEFGTFYSGNYIYVFFGFSPRIGKNLSSIERINVDNNNKFELIYINEKITLSAVACAKYLLDNEEGNILILGGFDGKNYLDKSLLFDIKEMTVKELDIVIPNMTRHTQFLFHKESSFVEFEPGVQVIFDAKNNVHLINKDGYELFSKG